MSQIDQLNQICLGYKFEAHQELLLPSIDDEIRRKEEDELARRPQIAHARQAQWRNQWPL